MALSELQLPATKVVLYQNLQAIADVIYRNMSKWEAAATYLASMTTADLDALSISTTDSTRAELVDLRNLLLEMVSLWENTAVTPVKAPKEVINKIRHMLVF